VRIFLSLLSCRSPSVISLQDPDQRLELESGSPLEVEFSFGIHWHFTPTVHADRNSLHGASLISEQAVEIHWLSIINSFVLVVLLIAFLAIILTRVQHSTHCLSVLKH
jgi:hypothetical protein